MDTALPQKFPFILDRNLAKANCKEDRVCTSCDKVVLGFSINEVQTYKMESFVLVSYCLFYMKSLNFFLVLKKLHFIFLWKMIDLLSLKNWVFSHKLIFDC